MKIDNVPFLNREQRRRLGRELKLSPCANGFMDLNEGVPVSDAFAVAMFLEKHVGASTTKIIAVFEFILFGPKITPAQKVYTVIVQKWKQCESGQQDEPDGYSLHLTGRDREVFVNAFGRAVLKTHHKHWLPGHVPDYYVTTDELPYMAEVDEATFKKVRRRKKKHGMRFSQNDHIGFVGLILPD